MRLFVLVACLCLSLVSVSVPVSVSAATRTWQANSNGWDGDRQDNVRWSPAGVTPTANDDVVIGPGASTAFTVNFPESETFQSLTLAPGARLNLNGYTLTVNTLDFDFSPGLQTAPITIFNGNITVKANAYINKINGAVTPTVVLSGANIIINDGASALVGTTATANTPTQRITIQFTAAEGKRSGIVNRNNFNIEGNVPVTFSGDGTSVFQHPADVEPNWTIKRSLSMSNAGDEAARLFTASAMQFELWNGILKLTADASIPAFVESNVTRLDLSNYTNTKQRGYVVELPVNSGGTFVLSYPAQLLCADQINTVSIQSELRVYGADMRCGGIMFQREATIDLMTPKGVGLAQAAGAAPGTLKWESTVLCAATDLNLHGNTLSVQTLTIPFSYASAALTSIRDGSIEVREWVMDSFNLAAAANINTLQLKNVRVNIPATNKWLIGHYQDAMATTSAFKLRIELLSSDAPGAMASSITNRGTFAIVGNVPVELIGNGAASCVYEQPSDVGAKDSQLTLQRTGNVAGRDASDMFTWRGLEVRILNGRVHLEAARIPDTAGDSATQFEQLAAAGAVGTIPAMPIGGGSGRMIVSYPAKLSCSAPIVAAIIRGELELFGVENLCTGMAFANTAVVHIKSGSGVSFADSAANVTVQGGDALYWNGTTLLSAAARVAGYQHALFVNQLVTDFRVLGTTARTTFANLRIRAQQWILNSYTTAASDIQNHRVILDNTTIEVAGVVGTNSDAFLYLGPQTAAPAAAVPKPLMIASAAADINSAESAVLVYGTLIGRAPFLTAMAVPFTQMPGAALVMDRGAAQLRFWANGAFGDNTGAASTMALNGDNVQLTFEGASYIFPTSTTKYTKTGTGQATCLRAAAVVKAATLGVCSSTLDSIPSTAFATATTPAPSSTGGSGGATNPPTGTGTGPTDAPGTGTTPATGTGTGSSSTTPAPGTTETSGTTPAPGTSSSTGTGTNTNTAGTGTSSSSSSTGVVVPNAAVAVSVSSASSSLLCAVFLSVAALVL